MDTRVPADDGGWSPPPGVGGEAGSIEERLAAIEHRLDTLERTVRETVTEELHTAGDELRRAVSDLGRLLLRDLDRLTKVLAEHRDAIVERVTTAVVPALEAAAPDPEPVPSTTGESATSESGEGEGKGDDGRWRRKARRSPKAGGEGDTHDE